MYGRTMSTSRNVVVTIAAAVFAICLVGSEEATAAASSRDRPTAEQTELEPQEPGTRPPQELSSLPRTFTPISRLPDSQIQVRTADICLQIQGFLTRPIFGPTPNKTTKHQAARSLIFIVDPTCGICLQVQNLNSGNHFSTETFVSFVKMSSLTNFTGQAYQPQEDKYVCSTAAFPRYII